MYRLRMSSVFVHGGMGIRSVPRNAAETEKRPESDRQVQTESTNMILVNPQMQLVKIIHGPNADDFDCAGAKVSLVRQNLRHAFNLVDDTLAFVNGDVVVDDLQLRPDDTLEFVLPWGRKGASDNRDDYFLNSTDHLLKLNEVLYRLGRLEQLLEDVLKQQAPAKEVYTVEEFGKLVDLSAYTVREHCRLGRLQATKTVSGRGNIPEWRIPHVELIRYRNYGLLPLRKHGG